MSLYKILFAIIFASFFQGMQIIASNSMNRLQYLSKVLQIDLSQKNNKTDKIQYRTDSDILIKILVQKGQVEHIGLSLFDESTWSSETTDIGRFIESYTLELLLSDDYKSKLYEDEVEFVKGSPEILAQLAGNQIDYSLQIKDFKCKASIYSEKDECVIEFPLDYQLINGETLIDAENNLWKKLSNFNHDSVNNRIVNNDNLNLLYDNIYENRINNYLNLVFDNIYYELKEGQYMPTWNIGYPSESLSNLFSGEVQKDSIFIEIVQKKYGNLKEQHKVNVSDWVAFNKNQGCEPFWGLISNDTEYIKGISFLLNSYYGYAHILRITCDKRNIATGNGVIKAQLNSYIPISKINNIFSEY